MKCPFCGFEDTKVVDSRPVDGKKRRRRECTNCGKRFTTYESVEMPAMLVMKRDNSVEIFDKNKLIKSISTAVKKRPVSVENINEIVDCVESCYSNNTQISSAEIGSAVLRKLKEIDQVAYVRFASVYKDFSDVESFINVISELKNNSSSDTENPL